jgi:hypothetical protein
MHSLDTKIRENLDGEFLIVYGKHFNEGIEYASKLKIGQIQIRESFDDNGLDLKYIEKLSPHLRIISMNTIKKCINFESLYSLINLEKMHLDKQKFALDVSRFGNLGHLGGEYWKGLINIESSFSLKSIVIQKLTDTNLERFSGLQNLEALHIYSSKILSLKGIEELPIKVLSLAYNSQLEDVEAIKQLKSLEVINFDKCNKIYDFNFIEKMNSGIKVKILNKGFTYLITTTTPNLPNDPNFTKWTDALRISGG